MPPVLQPAFQRKHCAKQPGRDGHALAPIPGMYKAIIAVLDATRARVFVFTRSSHASGIDEQLVEQSDLVNPARRLRPSELFSDTRPALGRVGSRQFATDDHRDAHLDHFDQAFAAAVAAELVRIADANLPDRIVLCASPRMLGTLRSLTARLHRPGRFIDELPRDIVKLTVSQLREYLESYGLLPPRVTAAPQSATNRAR
jgi:protein required for attachment to host cells